MFDLDIDLTKLIVIATITYGVPVLLLFVSIISFAYIRGSNIFKKSRKSKKPRWLYLIPAIAAALAIIWVWYFFLR